MLLVGQNSSMSALDYFAWFGWRKFFDPWESKRSFHPKVSSFKALVKLWKPWGLKLFVQLRMTGSSWMLGGFFSNYGVFGAKWIFIGVVDARVSPAPLTFHKRVIFSMYEKNQVSNDADFHRKILGVRCSPRKYKTRVTTAQLDRFHLFVLKPSWPKLHLSLAGGRLVVFPLRQSAEEKYCLDFELFSTIPDKFENL